MSLRVFSVGMNLSVDQQCSQILGYPGKWTNGLAYFGRRVCDEKKKFCKTAAKAKQLTHLTRSFLHETPPWEKTKKKISDQKKI